MSLKALVAFGVAFIAVLLVFPAAARCSDKNSSDQAISRAFDAKPKTENVETRKSASAIPALTRKDVLARVLKHNPRLSVSAREVEARNFEEIQSGLHPNPELSVEVENFGGSGEFSGTDSAETTVRISQLFELGAKRSRRKEVGRMEREVAERESEIVRAEVISEASARFTDVLAARKRLSLEQEQVELTTRLFQTVKDQIEAGKTAAIEEVRIRGLLFEARLRQKNARQKLTAARHVLASSWGSDSADFAPLEDSFEKTPAAPALSELMSRLEESPRIALHQSDARKADRSVALERAEGIPDLNFSLGAKNDRQSGDNALVAEVSIPLPIFDRNQGAVAAARSRKMKAEEAARFSQTRLRAGLAEIWRDLHAAQNEVTVLREEILPASRKAFDAVVYGYRAGKFGFLDVLEAESSLFEAKSRYVEALTSYHKAIAELERLLGQNISADGTFLDPAKKQRGQS